MNSLVALGSGAAWIYDLALPLAAAAPFEGGTEKFQGALKYYKRRLLLAAWRFTYATFVTYTYADM